MTKAIILLIHLVVLFLVVTDMWNNYFRNKEFEKKIKELEKEFKDDI